MLYAFFDVENYMLILCEFYDSSFFIINQYVKIASDIGFYVP